MRQAVPAAKARLAACTPVARLPSTALRILASSTGGEAGGGVDGAVAMPRAVLEQLPASVHLAAGHHASSAAPLRKCAPLCAHINVVGASVPSTKQLLQGSICTRSCKRLRRRRPRACLCSLHLPCTSCRHLARARHSRCTASRARLDRLHSAASLLHINLSFAHHAALLGTPLRLRLRLPLTVIPYRSGVRTSTCASPELGGVLPCEHGAEVSLRAAPSAPVVDVRAPRVLEVDVAASAVRRAIQRPAVNGPVGRLSAAARLTAGAHLEVDVPGQAVPRAVARLARSRVSVARVLAARLVYAQIGKEIHVRGRTMATAPHGLASRRTPVGLTLAGGCLYQGRLRRLRVLVEVGRVGDD